MESIGAKFRTAIEPTIFQQEEKEKALVAGKKNVTEAKKARILDNMKRVLEGDGVSFLHDEQSNKVGLGDSGNTREPDLLSQQGMMNALTLELNQLMAAADDEKIDKAFIDGFVLWIQGKVADSEPQWKKEQIKDRTWWWWVNKKRSQRNRYKQIRGKDGPYAKNVDSSGSPLVCDPVPLHGEDFVAYLRLMISEKYEFLKKFEILKNFVPKDLYTAWLYWKYIVNGEPTLSHDYMSVFIDEFDRGNVAPPNFVPPVTRGPPAVGGVPPPGTQIPAPPPAQAPPTTQNNQPTVGPQPGSVQQQSVAQNTSSPTTAVVNNNQPQNLPILPPQPITTPVQNPAVQNLPPFTPPPPDAQVNAPPPQTIIQQYYTPPQIITLPDQGVVDQLQIDLTLAHQATQQAQQQFQSATQLAKKQKLKVQGLKTRLKQYDQDSQDWAQVKAGLEQDIQLKQGQIQQAITTEGILKGEILRLQGLLKQGNMGTTEADAIRAQLQTANDELARKQKEIQDTHSDYFKKIQDLSSAAAQKEQTLNFEITRLKGERDTLKNDHKGKISSITQQKKKVEDDYARVSNELTQLKIELAKVKAKPEVPPTEVAEAKRKILEAEHERDLVKAEKVRIKQELDDAKAKTGTLKKKIQMIEGERNRLKLESDDARRLVEARDAEIKRIKADSDAILQQNKEAYDELIEKQKSEFEKELERVTREKNLEISKLHTNAQGAVNSAIKMANISNQDLDVKLKDLSEFIEKDFDFFTTVGDAQAKSNRLRQEGEKITEALAAVHNLRKIGGAPDAELGNLENSLSELKDALGTGRMQDAQKKLDKQLRKFKKGSDPLAKFLRKQQKTLFSNLKQNELEQQKLAFEHQKSIDLNNLRTQHQQQMENMRAHYEAEKLKLEAQNHAMQNQYNFSLQQLKGNFDATKAARDQQFAEFQARNQQLLQQMSEEHGKKLVELTATRNQAFALEQQLEELRAEKEEMEAIGDTFAQLNKEELDALLKQKDDAIEELKIKLQVTEEELLKEEEGEQETLNFFKNSKKEYESGESLIHLQELDELDMRIIANEKAVGFPITTKMASDIIKETPQELDVPLPKFSSGKEIVVWYENEKKKYMDFFETKPALRGYLQHYDTQLAAFASYGKKWFERPIKEIKLADGVEIPSSLNPASKEILATHFQNAQKHHKENKEVVQKKMIPYLKAVEKGGLAYGTVLAWARGELTTKQVDQVINKPSQVRPLLTDNQEAVADRLHLKETLEKALNDPKMQEFIQRETARQSLKQKRNKPSVVLRTKKDIRLQRLAAKESRLLRSRNLIAV